MANINKLADSAERKLANGDALTRIDAARKAVTGQGIFNKNDVARLSKQILSELGRRGRAKQLMKKRAADASQKLHSRIAP